MQMSACMRGGGGIESYFNLKTPSNMYSVLVQVAQLIQSRKSYKNFS